MSNQITYGDRSRQALLRGINSLANAVRVTLGPRGRNVILGREMEHGQWWPNAKRRFFHKDHIDIRVEMHGGFHAAPGATEIMLPMDRDCCL